MVRSFRLPGHGSMAQNPSSRPRSLQEFLIRGVISGLLLAVGLHVGYVLGGSNFRTVLPGQVYRCAQPDEASLERMVQRYGIRTVINLRGCCPATDWYPREARITSKLEIAQEDISFSAMRMPSTTAIRHLREVLDRSEYPILLHCHQGADRTGMAAVMVMLLRTEATLEQALRHLGPTSGHLPFGKTRYLDRFFALYRDWLKEQGKEHTADLFRLWIEEYYCPGEARAEIQIDEAKGQGKGRRAVVQVRSGERGMLKARCINRSTQPWIFQPGTNAGIHVWWSLFDHLEQPMKMERAGLFHARVEPGEHLEVPLALPALRPGRYELRIDLVDEQQGFFTQLGNDPLVIELEVS